MKNEYDEEHFYQEYSKMPRSRERLYMTKTDSRCTGLLIIIFCRENEKHAF